MTYLRLQIRPLHILAHEMMGIQSHIYVCASFCTLAFFTASAVQHGGPQNTQTSRCETYLKSSPVSCNALLDAFASYSQARVTWGMPSHTRKSLFAYVYQGLPQCKRQAAKTLSAHSHLSDVLQYINTYVTHM